MRAYRKKRNKIRYIIIGIVLVLIIVLFAAYAYCANYYEKHFYPKSTINGTDVGNKSEDDSVKVLGNAAQEIEIGITTRDGQFFTIKGSQFDYKYTQDATAGEFLEQQNGISWIINAFKQHDYLITSSLSYSEDKLRQAAKALKCFDEDMMTKPEDAYIDKTGDKIEIVPETQGNEPLVDECIEAIVSAVKDGEDSIELTDDYYAKPKVTADSKKLVTCMDKVNSYKSVKITYDIGDEEEILDSDKISKWIDVDKKLNVTLDEKKVAEYVQTLATKYNTYGDKRKFKTTKGDTIEIGGGDYGWVIDKEAEAAQILEDIEAGSAVTREPKYSQVAKVPGLDDIGDTYVEIDYTNQHLYYYKDGKKVVDSDIVSGNISKGNGSPDGIYKIIYKQSPAVLKGENYASHVTYFMVFAYNVGIHDASWRDAFGGEIYKKKGSHGCVNVPGSFAKKLYGILETDTPVIAYYRESVKLTAENAKISNAYSYVKE